MIPCNQCKRHLKALESTCPFCGLEQRSTGLDLRALAGAFTLAAAMLGTSACGNGSGDGDDDSGTTATETSTETTAETTAETTTTSATTDATESTSTTDGTSTDTNDSASASFYAVPEDIGDISICDPFAQDCPDGEKCVPYNDNGGATWNSNKCVPVMGDGLPGEPCVSQGLSDATDDCDLDSFCWHTSEVEGELVGVCTEFCSGTLDDPLCPEGASCLIANQGTINMCIDECDPLAQDCADGLACQWASDAFICVQSQATLEGEPCDDIADCGAGLVCVDDMQLPACAGDSCCTSLCDLSDPSCAIPGTECVAFFEQGEAPLGLEDVGLCLLPP